MYRQPFADPRPRNAGVHHLFFYRNSYSKLFWPLWRSDADAGAVRIAAGGAM